MAICVAACWHVAACTSFESFADRQQRHRRYTRLLRELPKRATRADIYTALPPQALPAPPAGFAMTGVGAMATERYPLDRDYQIAVPFVYARSRFIYERAMAHLDSPKPYGFTRDVQTPRDMIFAAQPSIEPRDHKLFPQ